ncbi:acetyltransferase [Deinococcus aerius]|uniref:Acetyltransferase n=1 Tax=Deinococcus aerius TaxID=200253 RepID=A0A2I9CRS3_9DEIO|nr:GNAT family N-acetyltransferase [Deinococcus aerius]GBF04252.1 acetyltransferase [Deinococcus aerius]
MTVQVRVLGEGEADVLRNVAPGVFDYDLRPDSLAAFFSDPRHHLVVAVDGETVVGMAGGFHYVHPDKAPELYINEVGVADGYQGQGLGRRMLDALLAHARTLGCVAAWVLTEEDNIAARRLYASAGGEEQAGVVMSLFGLKSRARLE